MKKIMYLNCLGCLVLLAAAPSAFAAEITVSAAASLKDAFGEIAKQYQRQHPDVQVRLNTAASGVLLQQLARGAPVDVLATADEATMDKAAAQNLIVQNGRKTFARNSLVLVVPKKAKSMPNSLNVLRQPEIRRIALGRAQSVPAGAYAQAALQQAGLFAALSSKYVYTQNVRQALDYVARGEVDAAFVYRTDAQLQQNRLVIAMTVPLQKSVSYPIAVTASSKQVEQARRFQAYVLSPQGQAVLKKYGFVSP